MKDTFDKVVLDEKRKEEIRNLLGAQKTKKAKRRTWIPALAAVAALIAVVVAVPFTRNMIVSAAEALGFKKTKSGVEISAASSVDEANGIFSFEKSIRLPENHSQSYAQVKDGRLYCVIDDSWIDVTDVCSTNGFYRYETIDQDGDKVVIYVGGTIDDYGSGEFTYDADGNLSLAYLSSANREAPWIDAVLANEGIEAEDDGTVMFRNDDNGGALVMIVRTDDLVDTDSEFNADDVATATT